MAWTDILGQDVAIHVLRTHLEKGRVANAYLLVGPDGVGKRRLALEMAKALNCEAPRQQAAEWSPERERLPQAEESRDEALRAHPQGGILPRAECRARHEASDPALAGESRDGSQISQPCDACPVCRQIGHGTHPDAHIVEPGGASHQIGIDQIRQLLGRVWLRPFSARIQVVIMDGADRLTEEAANSLLKTLEEPPAQTRFMLLSAHRSHCLPTIVSRCQVIRCRPLRVELLKEILISGQHAEAQAAETIARLSDGSASRAIELATRWAPYQDLLARCAGDTSSAWTEQPLPETREALIALLDGMMGWLRDVAVAAAALPAPRESTQSAAWQAGDSAQVAHTGHAEAIRRQARAVDVDRCIEAVMKLIELRESTEQFVSPRLVAALARETWLSLLNE